MSCISSDIPKEEWDLNELNQLILSMIPMQAVTPEDVDKCDAVGDGERDADADADAGTAA